MRKSIRDAIRKACNNLDSEAMRCKYENEKNIKAISAGIRSLLQRDENGESPNAGYCSLRLVGEDELGVCREARIDFSREVVAHKAYIAIWLLKMLLEGDDAQAVLRNAGLELDSQLRLRVADGRA